MKYVNVGGRDRETDYQIDKLGEDNQIDNDGDDQLSGFHKKEVTWSGPHGSSSDWRRNENPFRLLNA